MKLRRRKFHSSLLPTILVCVVSFCLQCCNSQEGVKQSNSEILKVLQRGVEDALIERGYDSSSVNIILDTVTVSDIGYDNYQLVFAQYHSMDEKYDLSILGIDNYPGKIPPSYIFMDTRMKEYVIDSISTNTDSVSIYCRSFIGPAVETFRLSFRLNSKQGEFPWDFVYL